MRRQNILLQSKLKLLEEEIESLHDKIELTLKERNKLRKELQLNLTAVSPDSFENSMSQSNSPSNLHRPISSDAIDKSIKATSIPINNWNDLSIHSTSNWDVNYNTGYISRINSFKTKNNYESTERLLSLNVAKSANGYNKAAFSSDYNFGGSMATEINSVSSTPRSFR